MLSRIFDRIKCLFQPRSCPALRESLALLASQVQNINAELKPNGGSSLRDSINRIEQCQKEISIRQLISDQRQRAILSDMNFGVLETDAQGNCVWANRMYTRLTGRSLDELVGKGWINTIAHDERDRVLEDWNSAIEDCREFESTYHVATPDGERIRITARTIKMRGTRGEPLGYIEVVQMADALE